MCPICWCFGPPSSPHLISSTPSEGTPLLPGMGVPWPPKRQATSRAPLVRSRGPTHQPHILSQITQGPRNYRPMLDVLLTWCFLEKIDCDNIVTFSTMHGDQKIILLSFHFNNNQVWSSHSAVHDAEHCMSLTGNWSAAALLIRFPTHS